MISLDLTQTSSSQTASQIVTNDAKPVLSFSDLLRGISQPSQENTLQNSPLILSLDNEPVVVQASTTLSTTTKEVDLATLLTGTTSKESSEPATTKSVNLATLLTESGNEESDLLVLNETVTTNLSSKDLKVLINEAKEYLKSKITELTAMDGVKESELPKTLKGLVDLAKDLKLDISKISFEDVKSTVTLEQKPLEASKTTTVEVNFQKETQEAKTVVPQQLKHAEEKSLTMTNTTKEIKKSLSNESLKEEVNYTDTKTTQEKEIKQTPLFKAQIKTEVTTQELVNAKIATNQELKDPKQKADETLKMLLQGEKSVKKESGFTADFSVATARVIAPEAPQKPQQVAKSLESLLKGEIEEKSSSSATKLDGITINKADSLDVKMNEAKQMTKYLSADVKNAIEDYKSPFTRVKVALNPQNLGSVELTVVQRGKNLHINLSSNNAAINALAMNATDLKAQLQNNGINNASLNFNNNSQSSEQSFSGQQQQQQNAHQEQNAQREYSYLENEEIHEEQMSSLEIVVPNYA